MSHAFPAQKDAAVLDPERLRAANIHPGTGLATDYLNHFNEAVMLIELVATLPDCLDDVRGWTPLAYEDHYQRSNYRDKDLVLAAYRQAPTTIRARLADMVGEIEAGIREAITALSAEADPARQAHDAIVRAHALKAMVARAAGLMNAVDDTITSPAITQDAIDALIGP